MRDAARETGISRWTVLRLIREEKIAAYWRAADRKVSVDLEQLRAVRGFRRVSGPEPGWETDV